jgi:parallel beta-helix repeat protein
VSNISVSDIIVTGAKQYGILLNPASSSIIRDCTVTKSTSFAIFIQGRYGPADTNTIQNCTVGGYISLGIVINPPGANQNVTQNDRIGTNAAGISTDPNTGAGLAIFTGAHDNLVSNNLISGNMLQGIYLSGTVDNPVNHNRITNNHIGTAMDGINPISNVQGIVFDEYVLNTTVGGTEPNQGNIIAFNTESGIVATVNNRVHNTVSRNSIFQTTFLGIDLLDDKHPTEGVSLGIVGPNELAILPTITSAKVSVATGVISGFASPNSTIELFVADPSPSGYGSGKV